MLNVLCSSTVVSRHSLALSRNWCCFDLAGQAGCDYLTISPKFLEELHSATGTLERKLSPEKAQALDIEKVLLFFRASVRYLLARLFYYY